MKWKAIGIVGLLSFFSLCSNAQVTVTLPDTSFVKCLRGKYKDLITSNGQLNKSVAASITGTLDCSNGDIHNAEGLQYFTNVTGVNLIRNELETIPNIYPLTKLTFLNVAYNNLEYLPGIEHLSNLKNLSCYENNLKELPDLSKLVNLERVEAHGNQLTAVPILGSKPKLTYFSLNGCRISTLADLSKCPVLTKMRLYNNSLTFREIQDLATFSRYDTVFPLHPQERLVVKFAKQVREADTLLLSTGIDQGVHNVRYHWFKNGKPIDTTEMDSFIIPKVAFADSGNYTCEIRHLAFSSVILKSDEFKVQVLPCIDLGQISISTTAINCLNKGSLFVNAGSENINMYELKSLSTTNKLRSSIATLDNLSEQHYSLSLTKANGCTKQYPKTITLLREDCDEILLSPDNDGLGDSYFFNEQGMVTIYDKQGHKVKTLAIPGAWDGSSEKGMVFSGFYVADINDGAKLLGITVLY